MACGSVVQSAHVPVYEQPRGRHMRSERRAAGSEIPIFNIAAPYAWGPVDFFPKSGCVARSVEVWLRELAFCQSVGRSCPSAGLAGRSVGRSL